MSILWFIFLLYIGSKGIEIGNTAGIMLALFYVGDCVLIKKGKRRANDGKND